MIANPATAPMTIPAMAPPPNPLELDEGVGVGVSVVVPVLIGVEVPVRPVGVVLASSVGEESLPEVSGAAVTVTIVTFVAHSSQVLAPPARTSVAQICAVEPLMVGIVNIAISNKSGGCIPCETCLSASTSRLREIITLSCDRWHYHCSPGKRALAC